MGRAGAAGSESSSEADESAGRLNPVRATPVGCQYSEVPIFRASILAAVLIRLCVGQTTPKPPNDIYSVPPVDAPELARRGPHAVGVRTEHVNNPGQVDIVHWNEMTGKAPLYDRPLTLEIWYPATIPAGQQERTSYQVAVPFGPGGPTPGTSETIAVAGKALRDAPAVAGQAFPLVIVSHGFPGSRYGLTYLTENLASKGYVVVAIDHTDSLIGAPRSFQSTLLNRSRDQLFTLHWVERMAAQPDHFLHGMVDTSRAAVVGYSMGGFGALASAGAGYSEQSTAAHFVPGGYFGQLIAERRKEAQSVPSNLKAIVAIAPWGKQPPYKSWDADGLAGIRIPSLFIAGDQDDVAGFTLGIEPAFREAVNSDRCMLVYENASHNVGGNPPPPEALGNFTTREYYDEPVWRKDRITAINQHFVTAFLDLYLKGDESKRSYLHLAIEKSNDGKWAGPQDESAAGAYSDGKNYWKGFQRRWAMGMEMRCANGMTSGSSR